MREISVGTPVPGQSFEDFAKGIFQQIEQASREDALTIADGYSVVNFTTTRTLDASTATTAQLANFIATFIDDLQKRGPNRVQ